MQRGMRVNHRKIRAMTDRRRILLSNKRWLEKQDIEWSEWKESKKEGEKEAEKESAFRDMIIAICTSAGISAAVIAFIKFYGLWL